jgi:hypothetical protein
MPLGRVESSAKTKAGNNAIRAEARTGFKPAKIAEKRSLLLIILSLTLHILPSTRNYKHSAVCLMSKPILMVS